MADERLRARLELEALPDDEALVRRLTGREAISQPFRFDLDVVLRGRRGAEHAGEIERLIGSRGAIVWERGGAEVRRVHGMACEVRTGLSEQADHRLVHLTFVPRLWELGLVQKIEIFMDMTIPQIVAKVLDLHGLAARRDFDLDRLADHPKREFVVQYAETDLAFVTRLCEHLGISIYFSHDGGVDRAVFVDRNGDFERIEADAIPWRDRGDLRDLHELEVTRRMIPAVYAVHDYNYRTPLVDLQDRHEAASGHLGGVVEFGAHVKTVEEARALAIVRAEEREATSLVYRGSTDVPTIGAGRTFRVDGHPTLEHADLLVVEVEHRFTQSVLVGGDAHEEWRYANTFHAIPTDRTYRPPRVTPVPKVPGLLTGIIEGPEGTTGDFASIDGEGRYLVRFVYDTTSRSERAASRPVRMAQNHAGTGYGTHFPLKPGVEVVLAFVNGDPDRPIIVGAVPNPITATPVRDANLTSNMIKTASGIFFDFNDGPRGR